MESLTLIMINWKGLVLRGALAIILGLIMALLPGPTLTAAALLIGLFVLLLGAVGIAMFISMKDKGKGMVLLIEGILGIAFGIVTIIWPNITALLLIMLLGVWFLIEGMIQVYAGLMMTRKKNLRALVAVSGAFSIVIGLIFILAPGEGALALIWLIGLFVIAYGILSLIYGLLARSIMRKEGMA